MVFINPNRGESELEIGGKERKLVIDFNVLAQIEQATGVSFLYDPDDEKKREDMDRRSSTIDFVLKAVAASLSNEKRSVNPNTVGLWFSAEPDKIAAATKSLKEALHRFFAALSASKKKDTGEEETSKTTAGEDGTSGGPS
jgi:hypothetical protein